jgi:hypothetical protein
LLTDAGFTTQFIDTTTYMPRAGRYKAITNLIAALKRFTRLREDCVYLVGQKSDATGTRYPAWLYEPT